MRCFEFVPDGSVYRLQATTRPDPPAPGPGRVVVRVQACSLNYRDHINRNKLAGRAVDGIVPLSDGAGEVVAVGPAVEHIRVGDRVAANFFLDWLAGPFDMRYHASALGGPGCDGLLRELADLPAASVVPVPDYLTIEEAACLPCAGLTAWHALERCGVRAGQTVLALGTGGVSIFALQFAVTQGCTVIITSRSEAKLAQARQLGAQHGINSHNNPDWATAVRQLTDGRGVDAIIEVGGPETLGLSLASLAAGGAVALIGVLSGFGPPTASLFPLVAKNATLHGIYVGSVEQFHAMNRWLSDHRIRPVIDRVYPFTEAPQALVDLATGRHFGKLVIRITD